MTETAPLLEALDNRVKRREERRDFFKSALGIAAVGTGAMVVASAAQAQAVNQDAAILNFALNLEYLEAQFYSFAAFGEGLNATLLSGVTTTGAQGAVATNAGAGRPRQVDFSGERLIGQYAREIAADEIAHVAFLRTALGGNAVAQPAINISGDANGAFTGAARAAGLIGATETFDPYASPNNFLLGAFIFEDVGVTAYKGAAPLLTSKVFLEAAAGILAVEAYHASILRTVLYARGIATPAAPDAGVQGGQLIGATELISTLRDRSDGNPALDLIRGIGPDDDQGIQPMPLAVNGNSGTASNIAPLNQNGLAYSRTPGQVLSIVYNQPAPNGASMGGFFPMGVNGTFRASAAS